jgi:hypothetical protein
LTIQPGVKITTTQELVDGLQHACTGKYRTLVVNYRSVVQQNTPVFFPYLDTKHFGLFYRFRFVDGVTVGAVTKQSQQEVTWTTAVKQVLLTRKHDKTGHSPAAVNQDITNTHQKLQKNSAKRSFFLQHATPINEAPQFRPGNKKRRLETQENSDNTENTQPNRRRRIANRAQQPQPPPTTAAQIAPAISQSTQYPYLPSGYEEQLSQQLDSLWQESFNSEPSGQDLFDDTPDFVCSWGVVPNSTPGHPGSVWHAPQEPRTGPVLERY